MSCDVMFNIVYTEPILGIEVRTGRNVPTSQLRPAYPGTQSHT